MTFLETSKCAAVVDGGEVHCKCFLNGEWRESASAATVAIKNPCDGKEIVGRVQGAHTIAELSPTFLSPRFPQRVDKRCAGMERAGTSLAVSTDVRHRFLNRPSFAVGRNSPTDTMSYSHLCVRTLTHGAGLLLRLKIPTALNQFTRSLYPR